TPPRHGTHSLSASPAIIPHETFKSAIRDYHKFIGSAAITHSLLTYVNSSAIMPSLNFRNSIFDESTFNQMSEALDKVRSIRELPLFPLAVVLFPGMPMPLHIFEPRYRKL